MPYTRVWNSSTPSGSEDADQIDDLIRDKLVDIEERLITIIGADGNIADPTEIVPATHTLSALVAAAGSGSGATGVVTGQKLFIPWYAGYVMSQAGTVALTTRDLGLTGASAAVAITVPFRLPVGATITLVRALVQHNDAGHTTTAAVKGKNSSGDAYTQSLSAPSVNPVSQWISSGAVSHVVVTDVFYGVEISINNNNVTTSTPLRIHGIEVTFTHPGVGVR